MAARPGCSSSSPSLPPPCPRSPPEYPDLYGKRREAAKVQMLEREIGFLEDELKFVGSLQPTSRCCKEVADFVMANPDPLVPTYRKRSKSCRFWKWLCGMPCFNPSWICCCCCCCCHRCPIHLEVPCSRCSCNCRCSCNSCGSCNCCSRCADCSMPKCKCTRCKCPKPTCCVGISCCKCFTISFPSCPSCSCSCWPSCGRPKCPKVKCFRCKDICCNPCLCY